MLIADAQLTFIRYAFEIIITFASVAVWLGVYLEQEKFSEETRSRGWRLLVRGLAVETAFGVFLFAADTILSNREQQETQRIRNENLVLQGEFRGRELTSDQHAAIVKAVKGNVTEDVAVYMVHDPEARSFGFTLAAALQDAGMMGRIAFLPDPPPEQTGTMFCGNGSKDSALIYRVLMDRKIADTAVLDSRGAFGKDLSGKTRQLEFCPPGSIYVGLKPPLQGMPAGMHTFKLIPP